MENRDAKKLVQDSQEAAAAKSKADADFEALVKHYERQGSGPGPGDSDITEGLEMIDQTLDELEIDRAFEGIKDKEAIAYDQKVEEVLAKLKAPGKAKEKPAETPAPAPEGKRKRTMELMAMNEKAVQEGLTKLLAERRIDAILENYSPAVAQAELFDAPFAEIWKGLGHPSGDPEADVETYLRKVPGFEAMAPAQQAEKREIVADMILARAKHLREGWRDKVLKVVKDKLEMYQDNQEQLEAAGDAKGLKENARIMENARSLISGFEDYVG
jgi:hypothetical protein